MDPADRAGPEDTTRAAQAGTADMGPVAPANRAAQAGMSLVVLADLAALVNRVDLVGMSLVVLADLAAPADRRDRDLAVRDPGRNLVHPDRAAQTPAHRRRRLPDPDPTRAHPHLTQAHPHRMRARPHLTRARLQELTHLGVATHPPVPTHPAEEIRLAEVIHLAEATHPGEATREADVEGATPNYREFSSQSGIFGYAIANYLGVETYTYSLCLSSRGRAA
ncbi:MAG TPA: hypothetical protein VKG83_21505 [Mycobacterium sp.]|nr:hypothetical protein [Mycobacterium sp.]